MNVMTAGDAALWSARYFRPLEWVTRTMRSLDSSDATSLDSTKLATRAGRASPVCDGRGFSLNVRGAVGSGRFEAVEVARGVYLLIFDVSLTSDLYIRLIGEQDVSGIGVISGGPVSIDASAWGRQRVTGSTCYSLSVPEGERIEVLYRAGHRYIDVKLRFEGAQFESSFGPLNQYIPHGLTAGADAPGQRFEYARSVSARATVLASEISGCYFSGELRYRYLQAKAQEMICELAAAFGAVGGATSPKPGLSRTNVEQLIRAREILTVSSRQRHDVHQIASQVGLNANKLCAGFKLMFGMTLVDYRREVSLLEARRLLDTTQLSVQKIADRIGYGHQSTFATAFKNRFGISPTLYRHKLTLPPGNSL